MTRQIFSSLREAIHHTATACGVPMKALAAELDFSPSNLSMRTTLGTDGIPFPADERLIVLQRVTNDHSVLATMADTLGYELHPKQERMPELVEQLTSEARRLNENIQLVLSMPGVAQPKGGKR